MNENIEALLENLVSINAEILSTLQDIKADIGTIKNELDYTREDTHSGVHLDKLDQIESALADIELNTMP